MALVQLTMRHQPTTSPLTRKAVAVEVESRTPPLSEPSSPSVAHFDNADVAATHGEMDSATWESGTGAVLSVEGDNAPRFLDLASSDWAVEIDSIRAAMHWPDIAYAGSFLPPPSAGMPNCHYHVYHADDASLAKNEAASRALGKLVSGDAVIVRSGPSGAFDPVMTASQLREALVWHGAQSLKVKRSFQSMVKRGEFLKRFPRAEGSLDCSDNGST